MYTLMFLFFSILPPFPSRLLENHAHHAAFTSLIEPHACLDGDGSSGGEDEGGHRLHPRGGEEWQARRRPMHRCRRRRGMCDLCAGAGEEGACAIVASLHRC